VTTTFFLVVVAAVGLLLAAGAFVVLRARADVAVVRYAIVGEDEGPPPPRRPMPRWLLVLLAVTAFSFLATLLLVRSHNDVATETRLIQDGLNPGKSYAFTLTYPRTMYTNETKKLSLSIAKGDMAAPHERPYVSWGDEIAAHAHSQGLAIDDADAPQFKLSDESLPVLWLVRAENAGTQTVAVSVTKTDHVAVPSTTEPIFRDTAEISVRQPWFTPETLTTVLGIIGGLISIFKALMNKKDEG
jgi:hypothetical protein